MITNIGVFGLKTGFVALMPAGNVPSIVATGKVTLEPKVVDGEVKIRNVLPMQERSIIAVLMARI